MITLTAEEVAQVGRTAKSLTKSRWTLTIGMLIERAAREDWTWSEKDGVWGPDYCMLRPDAAHRLARLLNVERPWDTTRRVKAIGPRPRRQPRGVQTVETILS